MGTPRITVIFAHMKKIEVKANENTTLKLLSANTLEC